MLSYLLHNTILSLLAGSLAHPPRLITARHETWEKAYWAFNPARGLVVAAAKPLGLPKRKLPVVGAVQVRNYLKVINVLYP